jgi:hypothetical protein
MPPTDLEVREALAQVVGKVDGLRSHPFTPGQIHPPAAVVIELNVDFDATMQRGSDSMTAVVRLLTGGDLRPAQIALSGLVYKVRDELWDDPTLGGVVSDCRLFRKRGDSEGQIDVGGALFAVVDLEVQVTT